MSDVSPDWHPPAEAVHFDDGSVDDAVAFGGETFVLPDPLTITDVVYPDGSIEHLAPVQSGYVSGAPVSFASGGRLVGVPLCPDRIDTTLLGEADNLRGRLLRGFVRLLDVVLPVKQ